jgi:hypothetical protein
MIVRCFTGDPMSYRGGYKGAGSAVRASALYSVFKGANNEQQANIVLCGANMNNYAAPRRRRHCAPGLADSICMLEKCNRSEPCQLSLMQEWRFWSSS